LIIIGDGPEMNRVREKSGPNVNLLGYQTNSALRSHLQRAKAFVFAAEEDFGILPVEAQACGTPVIAFGRGGVAETVKPGETGVLFDEQSTASLVNAVREFEKMSFTATEVRRQAEKFSAEVFRKHFAHFIRRNCQGWEHSLGL
jgi:glycosyltransferase involved in cell wall biosynthesis